jgi:hypothetical protein
MQAASFAVSLDEEKSLQDRTRAIQDGFIVQKFDVQTPETVFGQLEDNKSTIALVEVSEDENDIGELTPDVPESLEKQKGATMNEDSMTEKQASEEKRPAFIARVTGAWFQNILAERLDRWSEGTNVNMDVRCDSKGSFLNLLRGQFCCDASIDADRIIFGNIQMSGGRIEAKRLALNLWSFAPVPGAAPRYLDQFDFLAQNVTFTQQDLFESSCIRNGLRRLFTRILKKRGLDIDSVEITSITILPSGKISCQGQFTTLFGPPVPFEFRSGIGMTSRGGHILTLPGLEMSLSPSLGLFVRVIPEVTVDLGHNAQLLRVDIDGSAAAAHVSARVTITPEHTIKLPDYTQSSDSYAALCSVDVGRWLTYIGNFAK